MSRFSFIPINYVHYKYSIIHYIDVEVQEGCRCCQQETSHHLLIECDESIGRDIYAVYRLQTDWDLLLKHQFRGLLVVGEGVGGSAVGTAQQMKERGAVDLLGHSIHRPLNYIRLNTSMF